MLLQRSKLGVELGDQVGVVPLDDGADALVGDSRTLEVALKVGEIGVRPDLLFACDLAGSHLIEQRDGPIADRVDRHRILRIVDGVVQRLRVDRELVGEVGAFVGRKRNVSGVGGWPEILLQTVPPGPLIPLGHVRLTKIQLWVEGAERFGYGLDSLIVPTDHRIQGASGCVIASEVRIEKLLGPRHELADLILHIGHVVIRGSFDLRRFVGCRSG